MQVDDRIERATSVSKLIPAAADEQPTPPVAPIVRRLDMPLDVYKAIQREADHELSDPFVARRLIGHYKAGIWTPADARAK